MGQTFVCIICKVTSKFCLGYVMCVVFNPQLWEDKEAKQKLSKVNAKVHDTVDQQVVCVCVCVTACVTV